MSARGDRSQHKYQPMNRGAHGYKGVATDAQADPTRVYPQRLAAIPDNAATPLSGFGGTPVIDVGDGGEQTVRRLGPFHIAHDTPGIVVSGDAPGLLTFAGHEMVGIDDGTLVVSVWAVITEAWSNAPTINVGTSEGGAGAGGFWALSNTASTTDPSESHQALHAGSVSGPGPALYTADDGLYATVVYTEEDGPPAAGEADIYALIAEPAA